MPPLFFSNYVILKDIFKLIFAVAKENSVVPAMKLQILGRLSFVENLILTVTIWTFEHQIVIIGRYTN